MLAPDFPNPGESAQVADFPCARKYGLEPSDYALAWKNGLKPYSTFKETLWPSLQKVPARSRKGLLEKIYSLAAKKILMKGKRDGGASLARVMRNQREQTDRARRHIENAINQLTAIAARQNDYVAEGLRVRQISRDYVDIGKMAADLSRFVEDLKSHEKEFATYVPPALRTVTERKLALLPPEKYPDAHVDEGKENDFESGFISELERCIPSLASRGGRIDVERTRIMCKVFAAAFGKDGYSEDKIKLARTRLAQKPLRSNPLLTDRNRKLI